LLVRFQLGADHFLKGDDLFISPLVLYGIQFKPIFPR